MKKLNFPPCFHTAAWWKEQKPCIGCGERYSEDEADRLEKLHIREFSDEQLAIIEAMEAASRCEN